MNQESLNNKSWNFTSPKYLKIYKKLKSISKPLKDFVLMGQGIKSGNNKVFIVSQKASKEYELEIDILKKYIKTMDIQPYLINFRNKYLILTLNDTTINNFPNIKKYLCDFKTDLKKRYQYLDGSCKWYALSIPQNLNLLDNSREKILTPLYSKRNKFAYDNCDKESKFYVLTDVYILVKKNLGVSLKYILGLLNSRILNFYNSKFGKLKRDNYYEFSRNTMSDFPIKDINFSDSSEKKRHDKMVEMVTQMLEIQKKYHNAKTEDEKNIFKKQIDILDNQIDQMVYKLYGLTNEEIKIVEGEV